MLKLNSLLLKKTNCSWRHLATSGWQSLQACVFFRTSKENDVFWWEFMQNMSLEVRIFTNPSGKKPTAEVELSSLPPLYYEWRPLETLACRWLDEGLLISELCNWSIGSCIVSFKIKISSIALVNRQLKSKLRGKHEHNHIHETEFFHIGTI